MEAVSRESSGYKYTGNSTAEIRLEREGSK